ncbi:hypothetical protein ISF_09954 [Cordyceps fumosorosea ARSEF 2679]|uniref:Integral membrane protein n=1 Tax=Cordyceps fumosorosea (strain ARSEF 2679) TaxID=1081104 RepID=A0A166Y0X7_CORFA|nr:hypothetical protein ISF_09954 [Cordyceps fumosorosea ARSEF 2679]OAA36408.1 hypothetical protein ISF_09954 [Cordyceps fumosorosea ARSEF 2679]
MATLLAALAGLWTMGSILAIALRGTTEQSWTSMDVTQPMFCRWVVIEVSGLTVELSIWILAGYRIYALRMPLRKRVCATSAFGVRLLYVFVGIV